MMSFILLSGLLIKVITAQSLQGFQRPVLSGAIIESSPVNPTCCRDLSAAIQDFVIKNLRRNAYNTPIFGPISGPLIDDIQATLCSCPRCTSVNVLPKAYSSGAILNTANKVCNCGQPTNKVCSCGQPSNNVCSCGQPSNQICSCGQPSNKVCSCGQPSNQICSCGQPSNKVCSCGQPSKNSAPNCACDSQPVVLKTVNQNACPCNAGKNGGQETSGQVVLKSASLENCQCRQTRVLNNVQQSSCACGNVPPNCSCNLPELTTVNPNVLYTLTQSGLLKIGQANTCACNSPILNTAYRCSCGPILMSLNPNAYNSLIQSGLLNGKPDCSCAVSNSLTCGCNAGNPVILNTANNIYTITKLGCNCGCGQTN